MEFWLTSRNKIGRHIKNINKKEINDANIMCLFLNRYAYNIGRYKATVLFIDCMQQTIDPVIDNVMWI